LASSDFDQQQKMIAKSLSIKTEVDQSNLIRQSKDIQGDESRQELVEIVKDKQVGVSEVEKVNYEDLYAKSLKARTDVTNSTDLVDVKNKEYKEKQDVKVSDIVATERRVIEISTPSQDGDDAMRQKSKDLITN